MTWGDGESCARQKFKKLKSWVVERDSCAPITALLSRPFPAQRDPISQHSCPPRHSKILSGVQPMAGLTISKRNKAGRHMGTQAAAIGTRYEHDGVIGHARVGPPPSMVPAAFSCAPPAPAPATATAQPDGRQEAAEPTITHVEASATLSAAGQLDSTAAGQEIRLGKGKAGGGEGSGDAIYSKPELYAAAFSYRDIKAECKFLRNVFKRHAACDLGCGPAAHALRLATSAPLHVVGLELNPTMADYARAQVQAAVSAGHMKGSVLVVEGDLTSFQLQQVQPQQPPTTTTATPVAAVGFSKAAAAAARQRRGPEAAGRVGEGGVGRQGGAAAEQQFDMVTCLLAGLSHVLDNSQASAAFACVARVLKPGGLFVVELAHPGKGRLPQNHTSSTCILNLLNLHARVCSHSACNCNCHCRDGYSSSILKLLNLHALACGCCGAWPSPATAAVIVMGINALMLGF
ncbi:methyltransf_25 domain-containing protein, partial [Haematococcus lacustris]